MRQLTMRFAGGGIVRHLGLQNYKGPVAALSELIANTWDADASEIRVTIPLDKKITPKDKIIVKDNGMGMLFDDCDKKYLVIGRNRRAEEKNQYTSSGRMIMGHKGLGKLAGFGIAKLVEVKTISKGKLTHFSMSFDDLDKLERGATYKPKMLIDEKDVSEPDGTEIILKNLTLTRAINKKQFLRSMETRFSIFSEKFKVHINDDLLKKHDIPLQLRFPDKISEEVIEIDDEGFGLTHLAENVEIKWWIGFTRHPIKEEEFLGISILSRGRVAQDPWNFDLAGGTYAQLGLRYMTGQIFAEFVDDGLPYESDTILTNRSGLNWEKLKNRILYDWGRNKIKNLLRRWNEKRTSENYKEIITENPVLIEKIEQFPPREQKELKAALKKFTEVKSMKTDKIVKIYEHVINGYHDKAMVDLIKEISEIPPNDRESIMEILLEFDIFEAIRVHKLVSSHILILSRFKEMVDKGKPEKPDMHEYIKKYPWLIGLKYQHMDHEPRLKDLLMKYFKLEIVDEMGNKRPDIVVMKGGNDIIIIELKRPGKPIGSEEFDQIARYVDYLRNWAEGTNTEGLVGRNIQPGDIDGYLIAYDYKKDPLLKAKRKRLERDGIRVCFWDDILGKTEGEYREFLKIIKSRAPKDDPRILELEEKEII